MKYTFEKPLIEGLIKERPNRFIMLVEIDGDVQKCHCPTTGKIGAIEFKDVPCLLSESDDPSRKTKYTVEAIYPEKNVCVGINQTKVNTYVDYFLKNNALPELVNVEVVRREVKLNSSKIDFLVNNDLYLEVKTPLLNLPFGKRADLSRFNSFDRTGRHYQEISSQVPNGHKAIVAMCFMYEAKPFKTPAEVKQEIKDIVKESTDKGLVRWQINLNIDKEGVTLDKYFKLSA